MASLAEFFAKRWREVGSASVTMIGIGAPMLWPELWPIWATLVGGGALGLIASGFGFWRSRKVVVAVRATALSPPAPSDAGSPLPPASAFVPLSEAARLAFEALEGTVKGCILSDGFTADGRLRVHIRQMVKRPDLELWGCDPPSTVPRRIAPEIRPRLEWVEGDALGFRNSADLAYKSVTVSKASLDQYIVEMRDRYGSDAVAHSYIPMTEFRAAAVAEGWRITGDEHEEVTDLLLGVNQAMSEGLFRIWGRPQQMFRSTTLTANLVPIPEDVRGDYKVDAISFIQPENHEILARNWNLKFDKDKRPPYVDLHIDRTALGWLRSSARAYRGRDKIANPSRGQK